MVYLLRADLSQKPRYQKTNQIEDIVCRGDAGQKKVFQKTNRLGIYIYTYIPICIYLCSYMYIFIFLVAIAQRSSKRKIHFFFLSMPRFWTIRVYSARWSRKGVLPGKGWATCTGPFSQTFSAQKTCLFLTFWGGAVAQKQGFQKTNQIEDILCL